MLVSNAWVDQEPLLPPPSKVQDVGECPKGEKVPILQKKAKGDHVVGQLNNQYGSRCFAYGTKGIILTFGVVVGK